MGSKPTNWKRTPGKVGRPPAGPGGAKVKDYPQLSIRLPGDVRAKLQALAMVTTRPQWRLIADAIECYLLDRPEHERRMVDELVGRAGSRALRGRRGRAGRGDAI